MEEILGNPVSWVVVLSVLGALGGAVWWASSIHSKVGSLDDSMKEVRNDMTEVRNDIKKIFARLPLPTTVEGKSPLALTEFGQEISNELEAKKWADALALQLSAKVRGKEEFEIYEFCADYVSNLCTSDTNQDVKIRKAAYNHGIGRDQVLNVLVIELRDSLLAIERT